MADRFQMTYAEMAEHIVNGGVVSYGGDVVRTVQDLPHPARLAKGDPAAVAEAKQKIIEQQALLQQQLDDLEHDDVDISTDATDTSDAAKVGKTIRDANGKPVLTPG